MSSVKYIAVEKQLFKEGTHLKFDLYMPLSSEKDISCIKENGSQITSEDKVIIDAATVLYVQESQYSDYEKFSKSFQNAKPVEKKKMVTISQKIAQIYGSASSILSELFENPENLANYEASKVIVNGIVGVVTDNDFTIKSLLEIASNDYSTHTHSINVTVYSLTLGKYMKLSEAELLELGEAALLHDIGKSKIDTGIINKHGKLANDEFEKMKKHPIYGHAIALKLGIKNRNILNGIRHHHEKMDGSGYPFGMRGENIPLHARIIGLCDIFDALTSQRSYQDAMSAFDSLKLIKLKMAREVDLVILNNMILMFR